MTERDDDELSQIDAQQEERDAIEDLRRLAEMAERTPDDDRLLIESAEIAVPILFHALDSLENDLLALRELGRVAADTWVALDDWLGSASTRQTADDSRWRLRQKLIENGFELSSAKALEWRGALIQELNAAGFYVGDGGLMRYDSRAPEEGRIFGNADGPTLLEAGKGQQAFRALYSTELAYANETLYNLGLRPADTVVQIADRFAREISALRKSIGDIQKKAEQPQAPIKVWHWTECSAEFECIECGGTVVAADTGWFNCNHCGKRYEMSFSITEK